MACAVRDRISGLGPSSVTIAPKYLNLLTAVERVWHKILVLYLNKLLTVQNINHKETTSTI